MEESKVNKLLEVIEGISLNEWNIAKEIIDREFSSQARKVQFIKQDNFIKYLKSELIR
jgi:hypothetical protein